MVRLLPITAARCAPVIYENMQGNPHVPPGVTVKHVEGFLQGWTLFGLFEDDNLIGVTTLNGNRLHLDLVPAWQGKWNPRTTVREALALFFKTHESLFTSIEESNARAIRLAVWAGFKEVGHSDGYRHYQMHRSDQRDRRHRAPGTSSEEQAEAVPKSALEGIS